MSRRTLLLLAALAALAAPAVRAEQALPRAGADAGAFAGDARVPLAAAAAAIGAWLAAEFDLPPAPPPVIRFSSPEAMAALHRGGAAPAGGAGAHRVAALYDRRLGTIHLPRGWTGASAVEVSMLVHEMVHHLQASAGWRPACPAEAEALAYEAQGRWLALFGEDLTRALPIDPLYLKILGACGF
jgi:hypothetical protein